MKASHVFFPLTILLFGTLLHAQDGPHGGGIKIVVDEENYEPEDSVVVTEVVREGEKYDTAIFDTTWQVPFKIYENRGEEMVHTWIHLGAPRAPHIYIGAGIYRFDKNGLSDVQMGWYPINYPNVWESYYSAEHMFFLRKKSKEMKSPLGIDVDYYNGKIVRYCYNTPLRRDKFYGVITGLSCEGFLNVRDNKNYYRYGENNFYQLNKYYKVSVKAGVGRLRCRNLEYEAPFRRKGRFRVSSMSRLQLGLLYFPVQKFDVTVITGSFDQSTELFKQKPIAAYVSWEGRTAILHMKREWGFSANFTFVTPSWNRYRDDLPIAITCTWGVYLSLDKKNPRWARASLQ